MKTLRGFILGAATVAALVWGISSRSALGQQALPVIKVPDNLPPEIHRDTLSRLSLPKRENFTDKEEIELFDRRVKEDPEVFTPFHGTAHRLHLPVVSYHTREVLLWLRAKGPLEQRMKALTQMVAAREVGNQIEYNMKPKDLTPEIVDIVQNKKDASSLPEKERTVINLVREMLHQPTVSLKTYNDATRLFGERGVMAIVSFTTYYAANGILFRVYDTRLPADKPAPFPRG